MSIKKKSIQSLSDGMKKFENQKKSIDPKAMTDLQSVFQEVMATDDRKKRQRILKEFKERHLEFYTFLKENMEFVTAEAEITHIISAAKSGSMEEDGKVENESTTKLDEILKQIGGM